MNLPPPSLRFLCAVLPFLLPQYTQAQWQRGPQVVSPEVEGGHTWIVWRQYLHEFAPQLFQ